MSWSTMDRSAYAATVRERVLRALAPDGRCTRCGKRPRSILKLEVDHVNGRNWEPRKLSRWTRARRYERELEAGVKLRALCRKCNAGYRPC